MRKRIVGVSAVVLAIAALPAAAQYKQINLVGDNPGMGAFTDPNLKDPWGLAFVQDGIAVVANKDTGTVTVYYPNGQPVPVVITIPAVPSQPLGPTGTPTGLVLNPTRGFVISENGKSGPARVIVDTLDGGIFGWNPDVDPTNAVLLIDNSTLPVPASYTALTSAFDDAGRMIIYAADSGAGPDPSLSNNQIFMYDGFLNPLGHFGDPSAPGNMTVFGVQNIQGKIFVTYAAFVPIQGGVVDIFDRSGNLRKQFAANSSAGPLEEPWALVVAPDDFGRFGGALLIGNFGDGRINAYDRENGKFLGQLLDQHGNPLSSGLGLWALSFGNNWGRDNQGGVPRLYFTSGVNGEADGLYGFIVPAKGKNSQ